MMEDDDIYKNIIKADSFEVKEPPASAKEEFGCDLIFILNAGEKQIYFLMTKENLEYLCGFIKIRDGDL